MKKLLLSLLLILTISLTGCEKVEEKGVYKEGTYFGYASEESYGELQQPLFMWIIMEI